MTEYHIDKLLTKELNINSKLMEVAIQTENEVRHLFLDIDKKTEYNQIKVLQAMQKAKLSSSHFESSTGYGYNDAGRDKLEEIYSLVFRTEDCLVRPQIISGTHALTTALFGNLRYGDELLSPVGEPYDTLKGVIGINETRGSLTEHGIVYRQADLLPNDKFDFDSIRNLISKKTKMVTIQRSKGYSLRKSFTVGEIGELISFIKNINSDIIIMVDNCYGEFVDIIEPSEVGADLVVGSLIKNPGGGLAPVGGYIAGKREYVENAACRLSSPGIGKEAGPSLGVTPKLMQGLFIAPSVVSASLKGAVFASGIFEKLGYDVFPSNLEERSDIVQAINIGSREGVISFCRGIQGAAPVDSFVTPVPWDMPGYNCPVIMASGSFISGSSIELSADAPIRPPYSVFFQGALTWPHAKYGILSAINNMISDNLISSLK